MAWQLRAPVTLPVDPSLFPAPMLGASKLPLFCLQDIYLTPSSALHRHPYTPHTHTNKNKHFLKGKEMPSKLLYQLNS